MFSNQKPSKLCSDFACEKCDYITSKKSSYNNHLMSKKHKLTFSNQIMPKLCSEFICQICCKEYKDNSGLWRHKKKCINFVENKKITDDNLITMLINQCKELKDENKELIEIIKNGTHNTINNNSHNKSFNLNIFLTETCKDAMNINDFIDSIKLQLSDLEKVGRIGYVEGISNIITTNLKALDITERPIHCTDNKREVMYIKDEGKWEKEPENKENVRKAIKRIANKNLGLLQEFKELHPDCIKSESKFSDHYHKLIIETFGGSGDNDSEKEDKIIKNIAKEVKI